MMIYKPVKYRYVLVALLTFAPLFKVVAQPSEADTTKHNEVKYVHVLEYLKMSNTWLGSNPASLSLSEIHNLGNSLFYINNENGDFYRPQEPEKSNQFGFATENYKMLNDLRLWGKFAFYSTNEYNRNWGDVIDPYRGTPYLFADEEGGDWEKQNYELSFGASSEKLFNLFFIGIDAHYELHTGARQNDPRPLNNANNICIRPGIIFPLRNKLSIGLSGYYGNRNEEISTFVVNKYFQHRLYKLRGVGEYSSVYTREFFRAYNGNSFGGGLQVEHPIKNGGIIAKANIYSYKEVVTDSETQTDGSSLYQHGGEYRETEVDASITLKLSRDMHMHLAKGHFNMNSSKGIEHSQHYDNVLERWITFATSVRYLGDRYQGGIAYSYFKTISNVIDYKWMICLQTFFTSADMRFLLPASSQKVQALHMEVIGKKNVSIAKKSLHLSMSTGYKLSLDDELSLNPELVNSTRTIIIENILIPDFEYLITDYIKLGINAIYNFSLTKKKSNYAFVGVKATRCHLIKPDIAGGSLKNGRNFLGISIGMAY